MSEATNAIGPFDPADLFGDLEDQACGLVRDLTVEVDKSQEREAALHTELAYAELALAAEKASRIKAERERDEAREDHRCAVLANQAMEKDLLATWANHEKCASWGTRASLLLEDVLKGFGAVSAN